MSTASVFMEQLARATTIMNFTLLMISFVPGSIGLALNVFVFTRPSLRQQPCSIYFLGATFCNLYIVFVMIPVRISSGSFDTDPASFSNVICKLQIFMLYVTRSLACWMIVLACIDRYVLSSATDLWRRRLSSPRAAKYASGILTFIIVVVYSHMPFYFNISTVNIFGQATPQCVAKMGTYRTFVNLWFAVLYSVIPTLLMLIFGLLTLIRIRRQRSRVAPMIIGNLSPQQRKQNQLSRMLSIQVLVIVLATIFYPFFLAYLSITSGDIKDARRAAIEKFVNLFVNGLTYIAHASSFYLYTLTGSIFRREVVKILPKCISIHPDQRGQNTTRSINRFLWRRTIRIFPQASVSTGNPMRALNGSLH